MPSQAGQIAPPPLSLQVPDFRLPARATARAGGGRTGLGGDAAGGAPVPPAGATRELLVWCDQELSKEGLAWRFTHLMLWFSCSSCLSRIFPLLWLQVMTTGNLHMLAEWEEA
ncbi:unnamed protein product [Urochloa humidicola]